MKYGFYEKVRIIQSDKFPFNVGKIGIVTGISEDESKIYGYTVAFLDGGASLFFEPGNLEGTGEFVDKSVLYGGDDRVHVQVIDGEGSIV